MKKALHGQNEVFLVEREGKPEVWDFFAEELVDAVNMTSESDPGDEMADFVLEELRGWLNRYLQDGVTDDLLDDLNSDLHEIRYTKVVLPLDLLPSEIGFPRNGYIARYGGNPSPEALAADDFSKFLSSGKLKRLNRCGLEGCERFFLGPPQAKWCSKSCGSKFRVRKKRKRDSS